MIGMGMRIESIAEFNRRAAIALRGVEISEPFLVKMAAMLRLNQQLSAAQQSAFIKGVHRYRAKITDRMVTDYAARHAREAD